MNDDWAKRVTTEPPAAIKELIASIPAWQREFPGPYMRQAMERIHAEAMQGTFPVRGHSHNILTIDEANTYINPHTTMEQYMSGFKHITDPQITVEFENDCGQKVTYVGTATSMSMSKTGSGDPTMASIEAKLDCVKVDQTGLQSPKEAKMNLYEVYVVEYDENNKPTLYSPGCDEDSIGVLPVFAPDVTEAIRKATVMSGIEIDDLDRFDFLPRLVGACRKPKS